MPKSAYITARENPGQLQYTPTQAQVIAEYKRRGLTPPEVVSEEEKSRRRAELLKSNDVVYWINTYVKTYDPRERYPFIPFVLFPYQEKMIRWLEARFMQEIEPTTRTGIGGVLEKSRDVGASWGICAWFLHKWLFWKGFAGGVGSRKLEYVDSRGDPKCLFEKFRQILDNLPKWMIPSGFERKKHDLECRLINPQSGATIMGEGGQDIGRGGRTSAYLVDEYNKLEKPDMADASLRDTTNCAFLVGTPNGLVGLYAKRSFWPAFTFLWIEDPRKNKWEEYSPGGVLLASGTGVHPTAPIPKRRTYPTKTATHNVVRYDWYAAQLEMHKDKPWIIDQEIDIDYLGSGFPCFQEGRENLALIYQRLKLAGCPQVEEPGLVGEGLSSAWSGEVRTWHEPKMGQRYMIFADVAEGESTPEGDPDWSCAHIYDLETWEQVVKYRSRCDTHSYAVDLATLGQMYFDAEICVERTGPGLSVIKMLTEELAYPCIWGTYSGTGEIKHGFRTTQTTRKSAIEELASFISIMGEGYDGFIWNDADTVEELLHYMVKPNGRVEAEPGYHDDDVTCCFMAAMILPDVTIRRKMIMTEPPPPRIAYQTGRARR